MADEYGADDALLAAMAAAVPTPASRPAQPQPRPKIQQPTPQRLDKAPPAASASGAKVVQPTPQSLPPRQGASNILVSPRQRGNPVLTHIKSMPWEYSDIPADYTLGASTCALFLSLKYHRLHPEYVYTRIRNLQGKYNLRILLTMIDIPNHEDPLRELSKTSMVNNVTIISCWSAAEAARYLELYKAYEHASFDAIRGKQSSSYAERLVDFVTVPRSLNKSDAVALVANFGSLRNAINADAEQLGMLSGWGGVKVKRWTAAIEEPFRAKNASKRILPTGDAAALAALAEPGAAAGRASRLEEAVPLSRVPLRDMPAAKAAETTPEAGGALNSGKQFQFRGDTDDEDDELEAAATTASNPTQTASELAQREADKPEELPDGIAAALAKLRN
ncbi:mating-type switching protein swi10 [Cordyceps fumosorosea ARSEF 2679]|uniref:Mating-type switching protein swi10 n=1 Tax=Cordyceps fumosorosea (strain ARSEF 2679) TaxID=1081104 RepID=A0A162J2S1_CORFA|nr:mating-type switching protein swi10 [Cordyceps fumosorosea ARSEF 2679]OAA62962.1 mating-type switching protein swi10 [Cordyceps fumosorosea ARSEF 2679]